MAHDTAQAAARAITVAAITLPSPPSSARATTFSASLADAARRSLTHRHILPVISSIITTTLPPFTHRRVARERAVR